MSASRRRRYESTTAEAVTARKYRFRARTLTVLAVLVLASAVAAFTWSSAMWWACGSVSVIALLYLAYLRRQTRIEARVRRRRAQRIARSRLGVENTADQEFDVVPSRLRRPGAACWRSTKRIPSSSISTTCPSRATTTCRTRPGSRTRRTDFSRCPAAGSLLPVSGAIAQLVARLVRIEKVRGSIPLSSTSIRRSGVMLSPQPVRSPSAVVRIAALSGPLPRPGPRRISRRRCRASWMPSRAPDAWPSTPHTPSLEPSSATPASTRRTSRSTSRWMRSPQQGWTPPAGTPTSCQELPPAAPSRPRGPSRPCPRGVTPSSWSVSTGWAATLLR